MATHAHYRSSMRISFESTLCFGLPDPTTELIVEVFLKYKRWIFLRNLRDDFVDLYKTSSDPYACFVFPRFSYRDLRDQIRQWLPGLSPSLCAKLAGRIFVVYAKQVAFGHRFNDDYGGGAYKVRAFVEINEPELHSTLDYQVPNYTGVRANFHDDDGVVLYFGNDDDDDEDDEDDESSKPPRGLSLEEINGLKQERFKNGTIKEECSICLEEFSAGVNITPLPCSHTFHHNCIAPWLQKQGSCPFCRFDITQQCSSPSLRVLASNEII